MPHRNQRHFTQQLFSNNSIYSIPQQSLLGNPCPLSYPAPPPTPPSAPPPLITDTLTACLDVNGTYVCTSYSPRCYIIQKVTPNSVTVTPGVGSTLPVAAPPYRQNSVSSSPLPNLATSLSLSGKLQIGFTGGGGRSHFQNRQPSTSSQHHHHLPQPHPLIPQFKQSQPPYHHRQLHHGAQSRISPLAPCLFEKSASSSGGVYMNGEIGMPTMVYPHSLTALHADSPENVDVTVTESGDKRGFNSDAVSTMQVPIQPGHTPDLPIDELKRMLLAQLEYYFSPENLAMDKFLVSQMDQDHYVAIATLASFNMVKKLTGNIDLVTEVLRESKMLQVHPDLKRVRPVSHRTVVILRGIASSTSADEIQDLFNNENCPKCTGCEFAFNDSWYVSFESDEDAQQAHKYLREDVREFKGQPIMARIKSKPTTLLSQGVAIGVPAPLKNGYNQAGALIQPYMPGAPPYVPVSQQTGASNQATSLYAQGQPVPNVFAPVPGNYPGFAGWPIYDLNSSGFPMFPLNGLQSQGSPGYTKSAPMDTRPRNLNPIRAVGPRRTPSSSSDTTQGPSTTNNSGNGQNTQPLPYNGQPPRKNTGASAAAPLLGLAPQNLVSHQNPQNHNTNHHHPSLSQSTSNQSINGRHYSNSYSQNIPHATDNYHYPTRPYRGGGEIRPRGNMSSRRGPLRRDEEGGSYDYPSVPSVSNYRGNPSNRIVAPATASSQTAQVAVTNQNHQIDLDLEGSAFPPLPGSASSSSKNGDSHYEGRLSDVVKGVKSMRLCVGSSIDKDDGPSNEIVVSAAEISEVVVSAASPQKEDDGRNTDNYSSHKKEYREIGVGSADENNDICSSPSGAVTGGSRQMADKSTRTDENLLNGDQVGSGSGSGRGNQGFVNKKSISSQGNESILINSGKRSGVPSFSGQTIAAGTAEVPYAASTLTSQLQPNVSISSKPTSVSPPTSLQQAGRGAKNPSVAKNQCQQQDNNRNGTLNSGTATAGGNQSQVANDKDAFPAPNFIKLPTASAKPFSGSTDHCGVKEHPARTDEQERKESGQGDTKKTEDCSIDDGPVRLSYAQVAQSRKDAAASVPTTTSSIPPNHQKSPPQEPSTQQEDRKARGVKDTKDNRAQSLRSQRGTDRDGNNGRERDRGYRNRGGYRNRVQSDTSDTGSNSGGNSKASSRGARSPK